MDRAAAPAVAEIIQNTPAWARTAPGSADPRLRERAADTIGAILLAKLSPGDGAVEDDRQLVLPIA